MTAPYQIRLTGRASRLLQLLMDFGHLTPEGMDSVLVALSDRYGTPTGAALVDLPHVRSAVAAVLVDVPTVDEVALAEDWGPLFH